MTETDGERLIRLETQMENLTQDVMDLNSRMDRREAVQDERHRENTSRLMGIEGVMREVKGAFGVGRWVIHGLFALLGAAGLAVAERVAVVMIKP